MRNYLEDWLSEEESVVVPAPAQSVSRQRRTKRSEEAEGGSSAGQTSGKQIENDGARMVWTEKRAGARQEKNRPGRWRRSELRSPWRWRNARRSRQRGGRCMRRWGRSGGWNGWFWEKNGGRWFRWLCPAGRSGRRRWNIWTGRCSGMRGGMTVGFRCIKRFDLGKEGTAWR